MVRWLDLGSRRTWSQVDCVMDWTWDLREEKEVNASVRVWRLSMWVNGEDGERRETQGFSLKPLPFAVTGLFSVVDLALHCGAPRPTPVLADLQFRAPCLRSSGMSQGGPTRRCKLGQLFTSWSELVVVADSSGRNNRIRPQGTKRQASPSFRVGDCPLCSTHPRFKPCVLF